MSEITPEKIQRTMALELGDNDAGASTVRDYLVKLLVLAWRDEENFDGKRPFGNSSWKREIGWALVADGLVPGELDEDRFTKDIDDDAVDELILVCIVALDFDTTFLVEEKDVTPS